MIRSDSNAQMPYLVNVRGQLSDRVVPVSSVGRRWPVPQRRSKSTKQKSILI